MTSSIECCVVLRVYDSYFSQIWYKSQADCHDSGKCQIHMSAKSKMAAHAILNFGKYDNYVDETFAWYKWVRSLDDNSSNIPKTHDVISYRLAISSGSVFVEPGRNLPGCLNNNNCVGDDTKATARQSPNCIKKTKKTRSCIPR